VVSKVRDAIVQEGGPQTYAVAGMPVLAVDAAQRMKQDASKLTAAALALALLVATIAARSLLFGVAAVLSVAIGLLWTAAAMVALRIPLGFSTALLPPLLVLIGIAYPLSILARSRREATGRDSSHEIAAAALRGTRGPLTLAALCTAIGAGAFAFSSFPALRDFAVCTAIGVVATLIAALVFIPAVVALLGIDKPAATGDSKLLGGLEGLGSMAERWRGGLIVLALLCGAAGVWGLVRLGTETGYRTLLDPAARPLTDEAHIAARTGSTRVIDIVIDGYTPNAIAHMDTFLALRDLQHFIMKQPGVDKTISLLDTLALVQNALRPGASTALPQSQEELDQLLAVDPGYFSDVLNENRSRARILVYTNLESASDVENLVTRIEDFASPKLLHRGLGQRALFPPGVAVYAAGVFARLHAAGPALLRDEHRALLRAAAALFVVAAFAFLSLRIGFLALFVNGVAVLAALGLMGWTGTPLDVVGAPLAALILGLGVGQTIYYLSGCSALVRAPDCPPDALRNIVLGVGRPVAYSAVALALGFGLLALSPLPSLRHIAWMGAAAVAIAFIANLLVLATRVMHTHIVTVTGFLYTKVGSIEEIPLFIGLRPFQAKLAVLTGRLASARTGEHITHRGEVKQELYVLLNGRAEVRVEQGGAPLNVVRRGDVIGEMGLVREAPRSADVVAVETTEYLVLDGGFIDRLRRQYPRIAATVFLNLSRILSDRLEHTSAQLAALSAAQLTTAPRASRG
jgi:uncharacterized protein